MKIVNRIYLSLTSLITIGTLFLLLTSCNKDDNNTQAYEVLEEGVVLNGQVTLTNLNKTLIVDLSDGKLIAETASVHDNQIKIDKENTYEFSANSIKKITSSGSVAWIKEYPEEVNKSNKLEDARVVFSENTLYISYLVLNTTTYVSEYYLEALHLENGNTDWKLNVGVRTLPHLYQNRLITVQYPDSNSSAVFQYRNKVLGVVEVEKTINERINNYMFDGDLIIANSWSNRVLALDRALNTVWSFSTGEENPGTGFVFENQYIFFSRDHHLYSLNTASGALNWKTFLPERLVLGIHKHEKYVYTGQQTALKTMTLSKINSENGEVETTLETPMSENYYSTQLAFHKDYLLLITSPTSNERDTNIQTKLFHLPKSQEIWNANFNMNMVLLETTIESED